MLDYAPAVRPALAEGEPGRAPFRRQALRSAVGFSSLRLPGSWRSTRAISRSGRAPDPSGPCLAGQLHRPRACRRERPPADGTATLRASLPRPGRTCLGCWRGGHGTYGPGGAPARQSGRKCLKSGVEGIHSQDTPPCCAMVDGDVNVDRSQREQLSQPGADAAMPPVASRHHGLGRRLLIGHPLRPQAAR